MAKKKNNQTVINNIGSVNMEIDYDKLAEAIVNAQQKVEKHKKNQELQFETECKKLSVRETFMIILAIITNKAKSNGTMTSGFLGGLMSIFFNFLAIFGVVLLVVLFTAGFIAIKDFAWTWETFNTNIFLILLNIIAIVITAIISFTFRAVANEIDKEKDRNYIISVFSAVVAFVALVISVVDVVKGVI